jgi:succinate dehydrogenase/fumarate reductase flavoprotein subunit
MLAKNIKWHSESEIVIAGYGGAGAVAAITAHDAGRDVLILEKQAKDHRHPSTLLSGGSIICPDDADDAVDHMVALYKAGPDLYETGPDVLRAWAHYCAQNVNWIESNGGKVEPFSEVGEQDGVPGYEAIQSYRFALGDFPTPWGLSGYGYGLFTWLQELVAQRSIDIEYETSAQWLLTDGDGAVVGIQADQAGRKVNIRASRAVILTTGGFEFNDKLKLAHLRVAPTHFYANPDNTGDGVLMAQEVGAALWHMSACSAKAIAMFPDFHTGFQIHLRGYEERTRREQRGRFADGPAISADSAKVQSRTDHDEPAQAACGFIQVDRFGHRFTNELWKGHTHYYELTAFDSHRTLYPRVPSYWIFDETRMQRGQLVFRENGAAGPLQLYPWSQDNLKELDGGWITKGKTIEDLARSLDIEPSAMGDTLREYDQACSRGVDRLGRPPHTLVPLEPPFYAMKLWPGGPNTQGGPERNARAQVMSVTGEAIPRLYAAGELGSIYGMLYPGAGGNIGECIAFGRIAGENASAESRR